jgi:hypothetical protein
LGYPYSIFTACTSVLSLNKKAVSEVNVVADSLLTRRPQTRERLPTVHEELTVTNKFKSDNTVKARKVPLWQKMENKVVVTRVKKAKELLNYKKQIMQGSTEEVDEEEIKGEGFVDREVSLESSISNHPVL